MKAEVITSKTNKQHTQKQVSTKRMGKKINCTNSQAMKGRSLHNITPHVYPLKRFQVLLLCSIAMSTSIKKEINGPGASEWRHSHLTHPCHISPMSAGEAQRLLKPSV